MQPCYSEVSRNDKILCYTTNLKNRLQRCLLSVYCCAIVGPSPCPNLIFLVQFQVVSATVGPGNSGMCMCFFADNISAISFFFLSKIKYISET